jgi:signal transduction histidine kinase
MVPRSPLARLRLSLTLWYAGVFTLILVLLGGGLFLAIRHQISRQLDASLHAATVALMRAARIREMERAAARGPVVDAVDELHVPDRTLYLLEANGQPIKPVTAPDWIREAARAAARQDAGRLDLDRSAPDDRDVRLHAERFTGTTGTVYVAAAAADRVELEDQYASLIEAFAGAALVGLLLAAGGGYVLVRKSTAPIERSMDQRRRFMADAAHELRTPITILRTRAEVALAQAREPARDAATLQAIGREAGRLGAVVGDLLTLARVDAGEWPIAREALYLDDLAADAVEGVRPLAERKGVAVHVGTFDEGRVFGDPTLLRRLLLILLDNAVKFTPADGDVRLDVAAIGDRRSLVVTDTGIGIPTEQLPHVFERFYRGDPARREAEGAGLGLAIARWIAEAHDAQIEIASPASPSGGRGTRVTVTFPAAL